MLTVIASLFSLLLGIGLLLIGMGSLGTLLGVRAGIEQFGPSLTGVVMAAYFLGFVVGNFVCPPLIRRVGHVRAFAAMAAIVTAVALSHALIVYPVTWFALRVINGACMMGLYMVVESWLNAITPNERRGQVFAVYMATTLLAMAAGQYLILVGEITSLTPFALTAVFLALALVPVVLTRISQPVVVETPRLALRTLFALAPLGAAGALFAGLATGAFWGMGPLFAHRIGLAPAGVALFMSAAILGGRCCSGPSAVCPTTVIDAGSWPWSASARWWRRWRPMAWCLPFRVYCMSAPSSTAVLPSPFIRSVWHTPMIT
jgi:Major Facilitator Superfamily.